MLPLLLRPKLHTLKNSFRRRELFSTQNLRDLIVLLLAAGVMITILRGTKWALAQINSDPSFIYLPPIYPLGMILALLFMMLTFSCIALAVGTLFSSDDLDLILSSPISKSSFFTGKVSYILVGAAWMPIIFIMPLILAFGQAYHAPLSYYPLALLVLFPYFLIPAGFSVLIAIFLTRFVPASRSREVLFVLVLIFLTIIYFIIDLVRLSFYSSQDNAYVGRLVSFLSIANIDWMPSNWVANALQDLIQYGTFQNISYPVLLYLFALCLLSLAHLTINFLHFNAYSFAKSTLKKNNRSTTPIFVRIINRLSFLTQQQSALIKKEIFSFTRDVTQTIQLLMLLGLSTIYIFNLRIFLSLDSFPLESREWWKSFFFMSNCGIAAFVATGFCTRFVFTSISLEGRSLWILQTSPLSFRDILSAKFRIWYFPVAFLSSFVFTASAFAIGLKLSTVLLSAIASWFICYGIVGVAIGLGARFANFSWEHSSQLVAGFGSIVFMLISVALISLNLIPVGLILFANAPKVFFESDVVLNSQAFVILMFFVIFCLNYYVKQAFLKIGENSLKREIMG